LKGERIDIVNAEKAFIAGDPYYTIRIFKEKVDRGDPYHGPFQPTLPDQILKRMVRGMLPRRKPHGREAFKRLHVHVDVPEEFKDREKENVAPLEKEQQGITLELLSKRLIG